VSPATEATTDPSTRRVSPPLAADRQPISMACHPFERATQVDFCSFLATRANARIR